MSVASAHKWCSPFALSLANRIASGTGVYCGPASIAWIAAVWNDMKGRPYDIFERLNNKKLFPDGPRDFHHDIPGFQMNLSDLLRRETRNELKLDPRLYFAHSTIHTLLGSSAMPFIIRMPSPRIKDGLHYVTLFRSAPDTLYDFYWQDNGIYRSSEKIGEGLSRSKKTSGLRFFPGERSGHHV